MIRVRMELLPGGYDREEDNELLGEIFIDNDIITSLATSGQRGDYRARIWKKQRGAVWKTIRLKNFPRRSYHPWEMLRRILNQAAEQNGGHI